MGYEIYTQDICVHITQYCGDIEGNEEEKERIDMSQYQDSTDIFELLLSNVARNQGFRDGIVDYKVEVLFTKEINGLEMTKFKGEITIPGYEDTITYPVIAYGIKGAKTPVLIFAYEIDHESGKLEEWNEHLDEMVTTFVDAP